MDFFISGRDETLFVKGIVLGVLLFLLSPGAVGQVTSGIIDLSDLSQEHHPIDISGVWKFYPGIDDPGDIDTSNYQLIKTPGTWPFHDFVNHGHGIYHLKIKNSRFQTPTLKMGLVYSAYRIWIGDKVIATVGNPGVNEFEPKRSSEVFPLNINTSDFDLYILVSNYSHRKGGIREPVYLGEFPIVQSLHKKFILRDGALIILVFTIALFSFIIYCYYRKQTHVLYFSLFCFCALMRLVVINEMIINIVWEDIPYRVTAFLRYSGFFLSAGFIGLYQFNIFKTDFIKVISRVFMGVSIVASLAILVTPYWIDSFISFGFQMITLVGAGLLYYKFFTIPKHARHAILTMVMAGFTFIVIAFIHDILVVSELFKHAYWQGYGYAAYAVVQSIYFGVEYKNLNEKKNSLQSSLVEYGLINRNKETFNKKLIAQLQSLESTVEDKSVIKKIIREISNHPEVPNSQKVVLENLETLNEDFMHKLKKSFPELTSAELELCACIKVKLSSKEIALMRSISTDSVKKARSRLRKKLKMDLNADLYDYFDKF